MSLGTFSGFICFGERTIGKLVLFTFCLSDVFRYFPQFTIFAQK